MKKTSVFQNGLIWFGAGVSLAEILTGTSFAPLGMAKGFAAGIPLGEEGATLPAKLEPLEETLARVTLREGMYHQIKRMFGTYGAKVVELRRIAMGALPLDETLAPGRCRELTPKEVELLQRREGTLYFS